MIDKKQKIDNLKQKIERAYQGIALLQEQKLLNIANWDNELDIVISNMKEEYNNCFKKNIKLQEMTQEKALELNNYYIDIEYKNIEKWQKEIRKLEPKEIVKVEVEKNILTGVYTLVKKEYIKS